MKKRAVKIKITLWYAGIMILLTAGILFIVITFSEKLTWNRAEGNLKSELHDFLEQITITDGRVELEEDTEFFEDGVSLSMYDADGKLLKGMVPALFPVDTVLKNGQGQTIAFDKSKWLTYDEAIRTEDLSIFWVRAVSSTSDLSSMGQLLTLLAFISFPILAVLSIIGGYYVTGKALKPVEEALIREHTFTSDASHELRTPISVIMAESEYALLKDSTNEEREESLQVILSQAKHMSKLISQLLTLARGDEAKDTLTLVPIDLTALAHSVSTMMQEQAQDKNIRIETVLDPMLMVRGEESSLIRLFVNLLDNSFRYGKEGGLTQLYLCKTGSTITGTIRDNGIGISAEDLPHIWDRFYQAEHSRTKDSYVGQGLGLPMVQWIVASHHGTIHVESTPNEGTVFFFTLPAL